MDIIVMLRRAVVLLLYPLMAFILVWGGPAAAQIQFTRSVGYEVSVEPQVLTLERVEEFRPENPVANSWVILVPGRKVVAKTEGERRALRSLSRMAELVSGTYPRQTDTGGMPPIFAKIVREWEQGAQRMPPGVKMILSASFENNPRLNQSLATQGYQVVDSHQATPPDQDPITFRLWAKADLSGAIKRGKATARFHLVNRAAVDPGTAVFHGNFSVRQDSELDISEVPDDAKVRKIANELYADFSARAKGELNAALAKLNAKDTRLTRAELASVAKGRAGAAFSFDKKITITWFGKTRDVNLVIVARPGPLQLRGMPAPDTNFSGPN